MRMIETGGGERTEVDVLPFNVEFCRQVYRISIASGQNCLVDLSELILEVKGSFAKEDMVSAGRG